MLTVYFSQLKMKTQGLEPLRGRERGEKVVSDKPSGRAPTGHLCIPPA
jgi:hypothetical protein